MKIQNVSPVMFKNLNGLQNTQPAPTVTSPVESKPVKDIVSFSGSDLDESICNNFGLLKESYEDEAAKNITNCFDTSVKEGSNKKSMLDKFSWKTKDNPINFFGDEMDFVKALKEKQFDTKNFNAISNERLNLISYDNDGVHYNLKYDKKTHELLAASAEIIKQNIDDAIERIAIKPSRNNNGEYVAHYQFIDDKNGERAVEETYVLFDKNLQPKASHTSKSFQYSDGEEEVQKFARTYDLEGMPEEASVVEYSPYTW